MTRPHKPSLADQALEYVVSGFGGKREALDRIAARELAPAFLREPEDKTAFC